MFILDEKKRKNGINNALVLNNVFFFLLMPENTFSI